jgi:O-antigen/teichoic acid export membrane protein
MAGEPGPVLYAQRDRRAARPMATTRTEPQPPDGSEAPPLPSTPDGDDAPMSLRTRAARGTVINAAFMVGLQTLGLLKGFVIAAFLTKSEYGVWGLLVISLGTLLWLKEVGVGDKYVQQDEEDQEVAYQKAFTIDLISNGALTLLMLVALPLLALAYGHLEILVPGFLIVATIPATSFKTPSWIYYRRMNYARQRLLEAVDPVFSLVLTVVLAIAGLGYWALVIGYCAGVFAGALVAVLVSPYRLSLHWDRGTVREYLRFSWPIFVASASGLLIPQLSILVATRKLGLAGAGIITLAGTVGVYANKVDELVTWTLYPAICRVKDRTELLFEAFVKTNRLALMWGMPFGVGVAIFAGDLVDFGLGEHWRAAVGLFQIFGIAAALNHIGFNWTAFFSARGNTKPLAVAGPVALAAFLLCSLPLLLIYGLDGFGVGMLVMTVVNLVVRGYYLSRLFNGFQILLHALRAVAPTIPAAAITVAVHTAAPPKSLGGALAELALYVTVTVAATWLFERSLLREAFGYVRGRPTPFAPAA